MFVCKINFSILVRRRDFCVETLFETQTAACLITLSNHLCRSIILCLSVILNPSIFVIYLSAHPYLSNSINKSFWYVLYSLSLVVFLSTNLFNLIYISMPLSFYLLFSISLFKIDRGISLQNNFIIHSFLLPYDISCLLIFEIRLSLYNLYYSFKSFLGGGHS